MGRPWEGRFAPPSHELYISLMLLRGGNRGLAEVGPPAGFGAARERRRGCREADGDAEARAVVAELEPGVVAGGDRAHQGQPEAGAGGVAIGRDAEERAQHAFVLVGRDALAV